MPYQNLPSIRYPYDLDDYTSLLSVYNMAESTLAADFAVDSDVIEITPDFEVPERWSQYGGFVHIDDEDIFYGKGEYRYSSDLIVQEVSGKLQPSTEPIKTAKPIATNLYIPTSTEANSVTISGASYSAIGTIEVGGRSVDFAVQGNGRHGNGAIFFFSRGDYVQKNLCYVDADTGEVFIATMNYSYRLVTMKYRQASVDETGVIRKRIYRMSSLVRGVGGTIPSLHAKGAIARGYIRAEHYRLCADAVGQLETHIGVDFSTDRNSIDFRLRDLTDMCVEVDDWDCPEAFMSYGPGEEPCDNRVTLTFNTSTSGNASDFRLYFGDGTSTNQPGTVTHTYPSESRVEPRAIASNERCSVSTAAYKQQTIAIPVSPFVEIRCPDVTIPEIPAPIEVTIPQIEIPVFTIPQFTIPNMPTMITVNQITLPNFISVEQLRDITVYYTVLVSGPQGTGPCFQLVPCDSGYCHGS